MLDKIYEGYPFDEVLNNCLKRENEEYSKKINKCAIKTFLLIRKKDNRIIGAINIRWNLPESMKKFSGNIGYGIRPTERRKGYNKINLYLGKLILTIVLTIGSFLFSKIIISGSDNNEN